MCVTTQEHVYFTAVTCSKLLARQHKLTALTDSYANIVKQGPVIGIEFNGDDCVESCKNEAVSLMQGSIGLLFISQSQTEAEKQIEDFYNFADMQMAV